MTDPNQIAAAGVLAQEGIDKHLYKALEFARQNTQATCDGVGVGMVKALKGKVMIAKASEIEGAIATAARLAGELHIMQTAACVDAGVDTGNLTTVGGVDLSGIVQPMGGTR